VPLGMLSNARDERLEAQDPVPHPAMVSADVANLIEDM
jgi:hypothetical protein